MLSIRVLGLVLLLLSPLRAEAGLLDRAEASYQEGEYAEAVDLYLQQLETGPQNASVLHNLGLALERQGLRGGATGAYLRAVQLQPRNADFAFNLRFLLEQNEDKTDSSFHLSPVAQFLPDVFASERELFYASLIFLLASLGFAALALRKHRNWPWAAAAVSLLIAAYWGAGLIHRLAFTPGQGAVLVDRVQAYAGPTESVVIFELHEGAVFRILDGRGEWIKIELADQKTAWIKRNAVVSFGRERMLGLDGLRLKS